MVLLLIKASLKIDYQGGDVTRLSDILNSISAQEGYCGHSINWDAKRHERLLLIAEWNSEAALEMHLHTDEFRLFMETAQTNAENYVVSLAKVLSRGGFELAKEVKHEC